MHRFVLAHIVPNGGEMQMKYIKYILSIFIIAVILIGYSLNKVEKTIFSEQLIYGELNEIDFAQIDYNSEASKQFHDSGVISQIIENMKGVELKQLSVEEEIELFQNEEIFYTITLSSKQSPCAGEEAKGGTVIIFATGEMVFPDIRTMNSGRTISYINVDKEDDKKEFIIAFIKNLK